MKKNVIAMLVVAGVGLAGCQQQDAAGDAQDLKLETTAEQQAYGLGASLGQFVDQKLDMQESVDVNLDRQLVIRGFIDTLTAESKISQQKVQEVLAALDSEVREKQQNKEAQISEANLAAGQAFLAENAKREGVTVTESGLQYEVLQAADGPKPTAEDTVKVHYTGTLLDGTKFDSSYDRNEPAVFPLSRVIAGWTEGVQLMNVGSKYKFYIPADLAYGKRATGKITPNSTLVFEVELLGIESTTK